MKRKNIGIIIGEAKLRIGEKKVTTLTRKNMEIIGANIRRERLLRRMSMEELSEILQLSTAFIGLIERGQRGAKLANLMKISEVFGITVNDLIYNREPEVLEVREEWEGHEQPIEQEEFLRQQKKNAIMSLVYDFSVEEMEFVIETIKGLKTLKRNVGKRNGEFDEFAEALESSVNY